MLGVPAGTRVDCGGDGRCTKVIAEERQVRMMGDVASNTEAENSIGLASSTRTLVITITCSASLELFTKDFDELSPEQQGLFNESKIPCQESGALGYWCIKGCPFADIEGSVEPYW